MATIALYSNKINQMPGLVRDVKQSVIDYKTELSTLKNKTLSINSSVCNLDDVISSIQTSTQTQEEKIASLDTFIQDSEEFISEVVRIDEDVADIVRQRKDDFYEQYYYLKPECEKNGWEKFKDGCKKVGEWCKDNWKSIGKILVAVVIVVALGVATALTGGALGIILAGAFWGALSGALIGGIMGGITSAMNGGSFLDGFADGALSGAITGAITGAAFSGIGVAGSALGNFLGASCKFANCASKILNVLKCTSKVTGVLTLGMGAFDSLSMIVGIFDPDNPLVVFNQKLHSSSLYNAFQIGVSVLAVFSGGAYMGMQNRMQQGPPACFVAGTMILTASGLVAIENIKVGDMVISTNPDTFETAEKMVLETYIRKVPKLVHLTINRELISTTEDHPFYVKDNGFINACELQVGDKVINSKYEVLVVEDIKIQHIDKLVKVYNFNVDEFHTYYVGENSIFVHNANCKLIANDDGTYDIELSYKDDWSPEQRMQADRKVEALSKANTVKTKPVRKGSASSRYKAAKGKNSVTSLQDVDHTIDLQLGGVDDIINMKTLDRSVNRSLGSQINYLIKNLDFNTVIRNFSIH